MDLSFVVVFVEDLDDDGNGDDDDDDDDNLRALFLILRVLCSVPLIVLVGDCLGDRDCDCDCDDVSLHLDFKPRCCCLISVGRRSPLLLLLLLLEG
mmetsp:Transcript_30455/g.30945  ORF Transcript_30455/g.30945 Transcript_30455/m.30945 type:complete len:96 (+) Transcript_30455:179-466(+)